MSARNPRVILAWNTYGDRVALGPFRNARTAALCETAVKAKPGWRYDRTLALISGADLKWQPETGGNR